MMHRLIILFISTYLMLGIVSAQGVAVGDWRDHLPYSSVIDVAVTPDKVYAATPYSLFFWDDYRETISRLSRVEGLSDIGVSAIEYSDTYGILIISYNNANVDLILPDSSIYNIPDIKRAGITGNKTINNIYTEGRYAYLSCGFGIVVLDLVKKEIKDTYYIGDDGAFVNVLDVVMDDSLIFAASDDGIYFAERNSSNLAYFGNWSLNSIPVTGAYFSQIEIFGNRLFAAMKMPSYGDDTLFYLENNIWNVLEVDAAGIEITGLNNSEGSLLLCTYTSVVDIDASLSPAGTIFSFNGETPTVRQAEYTSDRRFIFIGDMNFGLVKTWNYWNSKFIRPEGPYTTNAFSLSVNGNSISRVAGGFNESWSNLYRSADFSVFNNEEWDSYYSFTTPGLDTIYDIVCSQVDPVDPGHVFAGSYSKGLVEIDNNVISKVYDADNSDLEPVSSTTVVKVTGLSYDASGNLWINTAGNNKFISVLKADGNMRTFSFPSTYVFGSGSNPVIDQNDYKWIAMPRGEGVFVFNDNGTIDVTSDDQYRKLSTTEGSGALPSMNVYAIAVDHDNEIWLGTEKGIAVIYNPTNVFEGGSYDAEQILVEVGGYVQPLLESEKVKCIAVDGANRKWIGTEKAGVFLISEDGLEEIYHFTSENSPLFSDDINGIAILPETGEVFFATSEGIISFRGTATEASENLDSILVFPNPVPSGFTGYVSVNGLVENAWVSITDVYGTLIYRTRAEGGQAVWNGIDMSGNRPATGVYLVFITNDDGSLAASARFMFYH